MTVLEHPDDRLSALLDGELSEAEAAEVHAHVVACADCSAELDVVRDARAAVRSLPAVEPPAGFIEGLLAAAAAADERAAPGAVVPISRTRRLVWANVAAAAVAGLVLVGGTGTTPGDAVAFQPVNAVARHASAAATTAGLGGRGADPLPSGELTGSWSAPEHLAGYRLVGVETGVEAVHLHYRKGPYGLSVFEQRGRLDRRALPGGGQRFEVGGADAWGWRGRVVVIDRKGMVVTLVGDESPDALLAAAEALPGAPAPAPSWGDRLKRACGDALEMLSPAS